MKKIIMILCVLFASTTVWAGKSYKLKECYHPQDDHVCDGYAVEGATGYWLGVDKYDLHCPSPFVDEAGDCNDNNANIHPRNRETGGYYGCDDDCDGQIDENLARSYDSITGCGIDVCWNATWVGDGIRIKNPNSHVSVTRPIERFPPGSQNLFGGKKDIPFHYSPKDWGDEDRCSELPKRMNGFRCETLTVTFSADGSSYTGTFNLTIEGFPVESWTVSGERSW